ncbi:GNAT family N-acetyltransferase [Actinoplanes rectilineatus]|uniref:GNAT family N-acetyltransferase n=1 Tax=Actinoplanes rectilineatus TaxID=113571 RepID=UPI0005F2C1DB|nr:GNAT family N-acetyltransferase [Actinoplanes rectilineatus]
MPELRPAYPVHTERLALRPLTAADAPALHAYRSMPDVCRFVPFEPMTPDVIADRLASTWRATALTGEGQGLCLGIELRQTGELVGDVVLFYTSREHLSGEIGYLLHPRFAGHGYATEATRAMLRLGFEQMGLRRITARLDERNGPSAAVARRLGMRQEARLVENEMFKGEWTTELQFAMLSREFTG